MFNQIFKVTALLAVLISTAFAFEMKMNTLYLTAADQNSYVSSMLESYGMNFDTVQLPTTNLKLENGKTALYNSIVIENATQDMLAQIKNQIEAYQKKYKVRVSYLNCEPDSAVFTSNQNVNMRNITLTDEGLELSKKFQMKGKDVDFVVGTCIYDISINQCIPYSHYEVNFQDESITPLLKYVEVDSYAGAIIKKDDLESIHFWIPFIDSHIAFFASHLWISWSNYGMIDGYRRLYFQIQVDDYFTDNCFNSSDCSMDLNAPHYRTSVEDMENLAKWQKDLSSRMPKGSDVRSELAINGIHILIQAKHKQLIVQDWTDYPQYGYEYKKPLGDDVGSKRWGTDFDTDWDDNILQEKDELYKYFKDPKHQDDFFWLTHTFSHQKLDFATYHDADTEMKLNIKMSKEPYLGMYDRPCYSPHSIVTPEISGLHNGDALRALKENGVNYAVGDTSRQDLSPANFYLPFISNKTTSNFDGFIAIPRQPPQIYWDCSTIEENMKLYKERYPDLNTDWNTHLDNEAVLHVKNFLKLRHDPYMFHEGNLRNADFPEVTIGEATGKFGMMQQWVERVNYEIQKYLNWPILTIKMDDLAQTYITKLEKEECQPQYTMIIDDATLKINEIKVTATTGECKVPLFAIRNAEFDKNSVDEIEQIGYEPQTAWVKVSNTVPKSVKFTSEVKWNDDTYVPSGSLLSFTTSKLNIIFIGIATLLLLF